MLVRHGFGVLALDARGYGASDGDPNAFGWGGTRDIDAAVAYLQRRPDVVRGGIGGLGLSVGGEQMLEAAAENPGLRAVVSDGAGERSVKETLVHGWKAALAIPAGIVQTAATAVFSGRAPPLSLTSVTSRISPRAAFFVYAEHGTGGEDLNPTFDDRAHEANSSGVSPPPGTPVACGPRRATTSTGSSDSCLTTCGTQQGDRSLCACAFAAHAPAAGDEPQLLTRRPSTGQRLRRRLGRRISVSAAHLTCPQSRIKDRTYLGCVDRHEAALWEQSE